MDGSPFLPEKGLPPTCSKEDATPPLSPDDLKYIEEFNSTSWDDRPLDLLGGQDPGGRTRPEASTEPFSDAAWYLTTSITLTTDTVTNSRTLPEAALRNFVCAEQAGEGC